MAQMRAVVDVPGHPEALHAARATVEAVLTAWGLPDRAEDARLVASELLANAIEHAPGREVYELEIAQRGAGIRLSVADGSSIRPVVAQLNHDLPRGRGMRLIEALTSAWGTDDHDGGKRVWVELLTDPAGDDPGSVGDAP